LFTICDEGTTEEAIREVELALNRLTFYQLGYNVKLYMAPADEYQALIDEKFAEMEAYEEAKKDASNTSKEESAESNNASGTTSSDEVITGEMIIEMMENGEEIVLERPRIDIFLVNGYENYTSLVANRKLAALDEKLSAEAKDIVVNVFPTFLSAAKIANPDGARKTYGIPMNKGIGEYEYIVFDKELLDKYEFDTATLKTVDDLETYLKIIKENEPDVVPLANMFDANNISYLFDAGFPAHVDSTGTVINNYLDEAAKKFYTLVSRYLSMGYLDESQPEKRFAVKFIKGTYEDLDALEKETGRKYTNTIYSYPLATNEDLLSNLFCVSKYCISNELNDVAKLLNFLLTKPEPTNVLTFGVQGTHYELNEYDQIVKLGGYYNNPSHAGNAFLTTTLEGENKDKWKIVKQQNQDSLKSINRALGFSYYPVEIVNPDDNTKTILEPNYVETILKSYPTFYADIISGKAGLMSTSELNNIASQKLEEVMKENLIFSYQESLKAQYSEVLASEYAEGTPLWNAFEELSYAETWNALIKIYDSDMRRELMEQIRAEYGETASEEQIQAKFDEAYTYTYKIDKLSSDYLKEGEYETYRLNLIDVSIKNAISDRAIEYQESDEFKALVDTYLNSQELVDDIAEAVKNAGYDDYQAIYATAINEKVSQFCENALNEFSKLIEAEYTKFVTECKEFFEKDGFVFKNKTYNKTALMDVSNKLLEDDDAILKKVSSKLEKEIKEKYIAQFTEENMPSDSDIKTYVEAELKKQLADKSIVGETALEFFNANDLTNAYNEYINEFVEAKIGLKPKKTAQEDPEDPEDPENPEEPEEPTDPEEPEEELTFFDMVFENRIAKQFYIFAPKAS
ncbi:hypothetical protein LJB90_03900, partial [Eubacteriales bacterium OttesenSCG-928-G02]|nr:hypothetical protein [Eubacteriales bacterium OttesenSCG-928-G02]